MSAMRTLYPKIRPHHSFYLEVGKGHSLYVEECGNSDGVPVVFLHGGPGAGCEPWHRQFFDPQCCRIILFDQRGCGRSKPHATLENNTTQDLVADMENIRQKLGVERWLVFGGSWGSTLGLVYAQTHPQRCLGLILRGIFLCRRQDIEWFYQSGAHCLFPDLWADFQAPIPESERGDMVAAYYKRLTGDDPAECLKAARAWSEWEGKTLTLTPDPAVVASFSDAHTALSLARLECHYFINRIFLPENAILEQAYRLQDVPGVIVHGRYDVVCPAVQAYDLHERWQRASLYIVQDAGHAAGEAGIVHHLVQAADDFAKQAGA